MSNVIKEDRISSLKVVDDHAATFAKGVYTVTDGVYIAIGYALANAICIETDSGLIIIDVMEDITAARAVYAEFKRLSGNKPVKCIIFTHSHTDHIGGIKGFIENENVSEIRMYMHKDCEKHMGNNWMFKYGIYNIRGERQFGVLQSRHVNENSIDNWYKNSGIGPFVNVTAKMKHDKDGNSSIDTEYAIGLPNLKDVILFDGKTNIKVDNIDVEMLPAFGETDDQILIYVPSKKVLLPGGIYLCLYTVYVFM